MSEYFPDHHSHTIVRIANTATVIDLAKYPATVFVYFVGNQFVTRDAVIDAGINVVAGRQQGGQEELLLVHVNGFITIRPSAIYVERFRAGIDAEKNKKTKDK